MKTTKLILYVDDDPDDRSIFEEIVTSLGGKTITFDKASALLEALHSLDHTSVIVFTDINMPEMNGAELLQEIRRDFKFKNLPVVMISTSNSDIIVNTCFKLKADLYLQKVPNYGDMREIINHVIHIDWLNFLGTRENFFIDSHGKSRSHRPTS
ncbi:response regulator [Flavobacterium pallidum]|uniref:Response regulatory domain-containing protein n=1 Tax=Flavobacterium pallidum TaxID=2172098 RepID=A0A2S1SK85_9FLAO|nr:response regulator [Flavobacterium pallidum]AWI26781.1 hypothetical protein HYN49_13235 [Flavobacterium pallidum]